MLSQNVIVNNSERRIVKTLDGQLEEAIAILNEEVHHRMDSSKQNHKGKTSLLSEWNMTSGLLSLVLW